MLHARHHGERHAHERAQRKQRRRTSPTLDGRAQAEHADARPSREQRNRCDQRRKRPDATACPLKGNRA